MIGKKLKKLVQGSDKSNTEIANHLGCTVNNLYNLYKKSSLDSDIIKKSCELFNVPLSYFFGEGAENIEISKNSTTENDKDLLKENYSLAKKLADAENELKELYKKLFINRVDTMVDG